MKEISMASARNLRLAQIATDGLVASTSGRKRLPMSSMYVVAVSLHEERSSLARRLAPRK
eukprot:7385178-Prymnesium_polylepis.2